MKSLEVAGEVCFGFGCGGSCGLVLLVSFSNTATFFGFISATKDNMHFDWVSKLNKPAVKTY